ncbi:MAG: hypothetical protein ACLFMO_03525 [Eubacteriales bacterium]
MKLKRIINLLGFVGVFLFLIIVINGEMTPFASKKVVLVDILEGLTENEGLTLDYEVIINEDNDILGSTKIEGKTILDLKNSEQSGEFYIFTDIVEMDIFEGAYYLDSEYIAISLPRVLEEPYFIDVWESDQKGTNIEEDFDVFQEVTDSKYNGRVPVKITNTNNKEQNIWLYEYEYILDIENIKEWVNTDIMEALGENINIFNSLNHKLKGIIYVDKNRDVKKIIIQSIDKETTSIVCEITIQINELKNEEINLNKIVR